MIETMVADDAHIMTDSGFVLKGALMGRKHDQVNHRPGEYVQRENGVVISTNTIEGYFATLNRGINGVYHHVGKQHLHRYLSEFDFRYNSRHVEDGERSLLAIRKVAGRRLTYRDSSGN